MSQARPQVRNPLFLHHLEAKQRSLGTATDQCGNSGGIGGTFNFNSLITDGFLTSNGTAAPGMSYRFDNCSQTVRLFCVFLFLIYLEEFKQPYIYNPTTQVMISYDDATSFGTIFLPSCNIYIVEADFRFSWSSCQREIHQWPRLSRLCRVDYHRRLQGHSPICYKRCNGHFPSLFMKKSGSKFQLRLSLYIYRNFRGTGSVLLALHFPFQTAL